MSSNGASESSSQPCAITTRAARMVRSWVTFASSKQSAAACRNWVCLMSRIRLSQRQTKKPMREFVSNRTEPLNEQNEQTVNTFLRAQNELSLTNAGPLPPRISRTETKPSRRGPMTCPRPCRTMSEVQGLVTRSMGRGRATSVSCVA